MITVSIYEYDEEGHLEVVKEEAVNAIKNNSQHFRICLVTYVNFDYLWWSGYYRPPLL